MIGRLKEGYSSAASGGKGRICLPVICFVAILISLKEKKKKKKKIEGNTGPGPHQLRGLVINS